MVESAVLSLWTHLNKMTIFFTADTHFCHKNIIKLCKRPFKTIHEHDETIISNWNSVVEPEDIVYHLGDFAWKNRKKVLSILSRLNGTIYLIIGNHDKKLREVEGKLIILGHYHELKIDKKKPLIILSHYAFETWRGSCRGSIHLHGHSHGRLKRRRNRLDVGVDNHDFTPISYQNMEFMATLWC